MHFAEWCRWRVVRVEIDALGGSVFFGMVWVEIGVLGWMVRPEVVGGEGELGGGLRGAAWRPRRVNVRG